MQQPCHHRQSKPAGEPGAKPVVHQTPGWQAVESTKHHRGNTPLTAAFAVVIGLTCCLASAGCSKEPETKETTISVDVPAEALAYAQALNNQDAAGLAQYLWFPGPQYEMGPVSPDQVPQECIEAELAQFEGLTIDLDNIRAHRRVVVPEHPYGVSLMDADAVWFPVGDGKEMGRQFASMDRRLLIVPWDNPVCEAAAEAFVSATD